MSLDLFLNELRALKVTLAVDGEQLSVRAPKGIITKELGATITARKQEILQYLKQDSESRSLCATRVVFRSKTSLVFIRTRRGLTHLQHATLFWHQR